MTKAISSLLFLAILGNMTLNAQIGVNTGNPQATFHVDGSKDNNSAGVPSATQETNDFTINSLGNVGIGTISPSVKLDIKSGTSGAIKITDGTQGEGKVLTSDEFGIATWSFTPIKYASISSYIPVIMTNKANTWVTSGMSLTVPETGLYYLNFNARAWLSPYSAGQYWKSQLRVNGSTVIGTVFGMHASSPAEGNNADTTSSFSSVVPLNKNDVLSLWYFGQSAGYTTVGNTDGGSSITIFRLGS